MKHKVSVMQEHINRGIPSTDNLCPIALAMGSLGLKEVSISAGFARYIADDDGTVCECTLPLEANRFIHDFDDGKEVKPFIFETSDVKYMTWWRKEYEAQGCSLAAKH